MIKSLVSEMLKITEEVLLHLIMFAFMAASLFIIVIFAGGAGIAALHVLLYFSRMTQ